MDKQEIIEGNKIIANFDSRLMLDESDPKKETWDLVDPKDGGWLHVSHLKYHEDWNQLMPVVDKISSLCAYKNGTGITVLSLHLLSNNQWRCHINYRKKYNGINSEHKSIDIIKENLIKATWIAVTQFIQWFNSQKQ